MGANPIIDALVADARWAELLARAERARRAEAAAPRRGLRRGLTGLPGAGLLSLIAAA